VSITGAGAGNQGSAIEQSSSTPDRVFDIQATASPVTISGVSIQFGTANSNNGFFGGNIRNAGTLTLSDDWILGGTTQSGSGNGISNSGGTLTVERSLISGNSGGNDSGGIQNFGTSTQAGNLTVIDSTISGNSSAQGGGIFNWCGSTPCSNTVTVINSTITHNDGGPRNAHGGGLLNGVDGQGNPEGTISVQNSIIAFNTVNSSASASNCGGSGISSAGYNIDTGNDCGFNLTGDQPNTDPQFTNSSSADNGGPTDTFGLDARSPAVDAIPPGAPNCGGLDQRGIHRPQGQGCDIGAFELFQPVEGQQARIQVFPNTCGGVFGQATINWGDGTPTSQSETGTFFGTHTYARAGLFDGSVTYNNDCVSSTTTSPFDVKVQNGVFASGAAITPKAGSPFTGSVATFTDAMPGRVPSNFTAAINWGDGSSSAGTVTGSAGRFAVNGSHTYARPGSYPTTIAIADVGGASASTRGTANAAINPVTSASKPSVQTTAAGFSGTVNPEGSGTTAHWEYGLDQSERGPGFSGNVFDQSTPNQSFTGDFSSHPISASVSNLMPNAVYHVRLVATNAAGTTIGPEQTFTTPKAAPPPAPVLGKENFTPTGTVFILLNGQFVKLTQTLQLPNNTIVDTLHGSITLVAASGGGSLAHDAKAKKRKKKAKPFTGTFGGAVFKVTQTKSGPNKGQTTLSLVEGGHKGIPSYASCKAKGAADAHAALSSRALQTLRSRSSGRFRTRGRYAAGTVRGTQWTTSDRCDGTLIAVQVHSVLVTDLVRHKTILVRAGHHYLAKAPTKRHK
jgi:hypothetical protein